MKTRIMFVCHGNICRSPMAEFIFKTIARERGVGDLFEIVSTATSTEEIWNGIGNPPVPLAYVDQKEHETAKDSAPDVVVIMLGTNDSKDMNADRIRLDGGEQYKKDMVSLINEYKSLDTQPTIFLALPPVSFRPENGGISNVNIENLIIPLLLSVAEETGATVIDTHEATKGKNDLFPDGVHPNDAGKDLLAKTVAEAILEEFSETKTPAKTN